jgi:exonuclease III
MPIIKESRRKGFRIATWNIQGKLNYSESPSILEQDFRRNKVQIACLQETKANEGTTALTHGKLICMDKFQNQYHYGLGFYVTKKLEKYIWGVKNVSNRIAVLMLQFSEQQQTTAGSTHFKRSSKSKRTPRSKRSKKRRGNTAKQIKRRRKAMITIINSYAPHTGITKEDPEKRDAFYSDLQRTYEQYKSKSSMVIVAGDFNSKIGKKLSEYELCNGSHGKGVRNMNGDELIRFMMERDLIATNTMTPHSSRHKSTWHGVKVVKDAEGKDVKRFNIHNQIDFILMHRKFSLMVADSRTYNNTKYSSDHSMLITTLKLHEYYMIQQRIRSISKAKRQHEMSRGILDISSLREDENETRDIYRAALDQELQKSKYSNIREEMPQKIMQMMRESIQIAANLTLQKIHNGTSLKDKFNKRFWKDSKLHELSEQQSRLRRKIYHRSRKASLKRQYSKKITRWKTDRNKILKQIKSRVQEIWASRNRLIARALDEYHDSSRKYFEATRMLAKSDKRYGQFTLLSAQDEEITDVGELKHQVQHFYRDFFNKVGDIGQQTDGLRPFLNDTPKALKKPITTVEIMEWGFKSLRNGRAKGPDGIEGELLKYGPLQLAETMAIICNRIFETNQTVNEFTEGILIPLNKPGKKKKVENTRPITLLNTCRKALSNVVLHRIRSRVESYLSPAQSGFRQYRSTADIIWTYRWLELISDRFTKHIKIYGMDMSKAFDSIDREKLMEILSDVLHDEEHGDDEIRIIRFLLANTTLKTKIQGNISEDSFRTTLGTPQGDALSPILFTIYLEAAMKKFRATTGLIPQFDKHEELYFETMYADDVDLIAREESDIETVKLTIENIMKEYNLKINVEKAEEITLDPANQTIVEKNKTGRLRKLGSRMDTKMDAEARIQHAWLAFRAYNAV